MIKRQKLSGAKYRRRKANREKLEADGAATIQKFLIPATTAASKVLNDATQAAKQPQLHNSVTTVDSPIFVAPVETTTSTIPLNEVNVSSVQLQHVWQPQLHDNLLDKYPCQRQGQDSDSITDKQDAISDNQVLLNVNMDVFRDAGFWPKIITDTFRTELVIRGTEALQNKDGPFAKVKRDLGEGDHENRSLSRNWFFKKLGNGENILRSWMLYSPSKETLYCFCCRLFDPDQSSFDRVQGFNVWRKLSPKVDKHESSPHHITSFTKWKEMAMRLQVGATLDHYHQKKIIGETEKWREILKRILDCITFLAKQNLPFRGHRENLSLGSDKNSGNFLELMKLLGKYDPVMREHLTKFSMGTLSVSYLSPDIQNEFIEILGSSVRSSIIDSVKQAKYFTIMFDSTPDLSHVDQMSQILRYVYIDEGEVEVKESFVDFFRLDGKTAQALTDKILSKLQEDGLNLADCRGQGYDNAATMAGIHAGVKQRILQLNPKAMFIPCTNHSLNLAGVHAAASAVNAVTFFGTVEKLYTFLSSSTHRWDILHKHVPAKKVKRVCETRWSSKHDAVETVALYLDKIIDALEELRDGDLETVETRGDAGTILTAIMSYSFISYLYFWNDILQEIDNTQKHLQTKGLAIDSCAIKMKALSKYFEQERNNLVENAQTSAVKFCQDNEISRERRVRRKRKMPGEEASDAGLTHLQEIHREQLEIVDRLHSEIERRSLQLQQINTQFGFLTRFDFLMNSANDDLLTACNNLSELYDEIIADHLFSEIRRFRFHIQSFEEISNNKADKWEALDILKWMVKWGFAEGLPNLTIALRIFLTMCVSIASCERSFSKLKLIKTYLRSSMSQSRLTNLAILSIERDVAETISFDAVIHNFAAQKARKINF